MRSEKKIGFKKFLVFAFAFWLAELGYAATQYLPEINYQDSAQVQEVEKSISQVLPWINGQTQLAIYGTNANNFVTALRQHFPRYDQMAQAKRDPIVITLEKLVPTVESVSVLNSSELPRLQHEVSQLLQSRDQLPAEKARILDALAAEYRSLSNGARGILTGVINALPADRRGPIFKAGDPVVQIEMLRASGLSDEELAKSFRGAAAGLSQDQVTLENVLKAAQDRMRVGESIVIKLAALKQIEQMSNHNNQYQLTDLDFSFMGQSGDSFLAEISRELETRGAGKAQDIQRVLETNLQVLAQTMCHVDRREILKPRFAGMIVEVHPYLAVYRGLIGGDCSTTSSCLVPYFPSEHDYYIFDENRNPVGYTSTMEVLVDNVPTLYVKDISGRTLSADLAELVLNSYSQFYKYYPVENLVIAHANFTDRQNHFRPLIDMFHKYHNQQVVNVTLIDNDMREFVVNSRNPYGFGMSYDNQASHSQGYRFVPNQQILHSLKVTYAPGTLTPFKPSTTKEALILGLTALERDANANISSIAGINVQEVRSLSEKLKNPQQLRLQEYYASMTKEFQRYGVELSRTFRNNNEEMFWRGHLAAPDAFTTTEESLKTDSEKYMISLIRRGHDFQRAVIESKQQMRALNQSTRFSELITLMEGRANQQDTLFLMAFAQSGNQRAQEAIRDPKFKPQIMTALGDALSAPGYVVTDAEQKQKIQLVLLNFIASFNNRIRYTTDQFKTEMLTQLQALGLTSSDIQGTSIERTIRIAALDTRDAWQGAAAAKNFADINAMVESGQMTQAELVILLTTVAGRVSDPTFANALIENLANRHHPEDIYMLNILSKYRYQLAATKLASAELKPAIIESLKAFYHHQDNANFREVFNQLWAKGIHLQDHVSHIWLLSNSVFGSDFRQASQLDTLVRNAAILHITLDELLENEAVRSHVAPALLQQNWLFDATQGHYAGIGVKLLKSRIVDGINHDRNWSEDIENVARHAEAIRSLPETQELIATLSRLHTARPWDQNIGAAMVRLSMVGLIQHSELQQLDQTTLIGQLNTTDVRFKAFVVNQLITRFHTSEFPEAVLEQIATLLVNDNAETVPDSDLVYSRMAADILMRVRTHNQNVQNELKASATEDDDVQIAIPAAIGFIRNGGNVGEIQAVMETIRDNLAAMENAPASLISLMQTLEGLVNPPGQNPAQCAAFVQ